jgi:CDGSH-type Zn-finger protein
MLVRGAVEIIDDHGVAHETSRPVVAVCRCGKSSRSPWCDGTHKLVGPRRRATPDASGAAADTGTQR